MTRKARSVGALVSVVIQECLSRRVQPHRTLDTPNTIIAERIMIGDCVDIRTRQKLRGRIIDQVHPVLVITINVAPL